MYGFTIRYKNNSSIGGKYAVDTNLIHYPHYYKNGDFNTATQIWYEDYSSTWWWSTTSGSSIIVALNGLPYPLTNGVFNNGDLIIENLFYGTDLPTPSPTPSPTPTNDVYSSSGYIDKLHKVIYEGGIVDVVDVDIDHGTMNAFHARRRCN